MVEAASDTAGRLRLPAGTFWNRGTIDLQGWFARDAILYVEGEATLEGGGRVEVANQTVAGAEGAVLTVGSRQTLAGAASVQMPVRVLGRIEAPFTATNQSLYFAQSVDVEGTVAALEKGLLRVAGVLRLDGMGRIAGHPMGTIRLGGGLLGDTRNADGFLPLESLVFDDTLSTVPVQSLEAMSEDLGNVPTGYDDNFALESVVLSGSVSVQLVDDSDNASGAGAEAVYVRWLNVPSGTTLDLGGLNLYARIIQGSGTILGGQVVQTPDGGAITLGSTTPGVIAVAREVDEWEFFGRAGQAITIVVDPGRSGSSIPSPWLEHPKWNCSTHRARFLPRAQVGASVGPPEPKASRSPPMASIGRACGPVRTIGTTRAITKSRFGVRALTTGPCL